MRPNSAFVDVGVSENPGPTVFLTFADRAYLKKIDLAHPSTDRNVGQHSFINSIAVTSRSSNTEKSLRPPVVPRPVVTQARWRA